MVNGPNHVDVALVTIFRRDSWRPKTFWEGCRVYKEDSHAEFILVEELERGVLMCPTFSQPERRRHYLVDTIDADIFLRTGN